MVGVAVALLPIFLIQEELSSGKLVRALNLPMDALSDTTSYGRPSDRPILPSFKS